MSSLTPITLIGCCSETFPTGAMFFGPNFELYIGHDLDSPGTLCAYGPTSDAKPEYNISCFGGAMTGRTLSITNKFSGGVRLCDVQVLGRNSQLDRTLNDLTLSV